MKVVIRADSSTQIGHGHVMRCLTLACALRNSGAEVWFICREHDGHISDVIEHSGFKVAMLARPESPQQISAQVSHADWLGTSWSTDVEQSHAAMAEWNIKADWLIVDHYALDAQWERAMRSDGAGLMVIDDIADREHDCDVLLDQNLVLRMRERYIDKVPGACRLLLGPEFSLLQPMYSRLHDRLPPREGYIGRILLFFGGADHDNFTGRALDAFLKLGRTDIEIDVVLAKGHGHAAAIEEKALGRKHVHVHRHLPSLASLMANADLAIGASGTASWERLCLGLPAIVITLAENQRAIAEGLSNAGLIRWLGHKDVVDEARLVTSLQEVLSQRWDGGWSSRCASVVDGRGAMRVVAALFGFHNATVIVRDATLADESLLHHWSSAGDSSEAKLFPTRDSSSSATGVWFRQQLRDVDGRRLYVASVQDIPIAFMLLRREKIWRLAVLTAPYLSNDNFLRLMKIEALKKMRLDHHGALRLSAVEVPDVKWRIAVCSDATSWLNSYVPELVNDWLDEQFEITWVHDAADLPGGDICIYLSYGRIVNAEIRSRYQSSVVVHESDLPKGRGWSPLTWQILAGEDQICVSLLEAADSVDSGRVYMQEWLRFTGTELVDELRARQAEATIKLCRSFVASFPQSMQMGVEQTGEATYYQRRRPKDSELDIDKTLREQFPLLRVVDNEQYPAWFVFAGVKYVVKVAKDLAGAR